MGETAARVRIAPGRLAATWVALVALVAAVMAPAGPAGAEVPCGTVDGDGRRQVGTAAQLAAVGSQSVGDACGPDASYIQTANIDLADYIITNGWTPIGASVPFSGVYDGAGFSISGFNPSWIMASGGSFGLFGTVEGPDAELRSIRMSDVTVEVSAAPGAMPRVGALAAYVAGGASIRNTQVSGAVTLTTSNSGATAGGVVALSNGDVTFDDVSFNGDVSSRSTGGGQAVAGGLVGYADGVGLNMSNVAFTGGVGGESSFLTSLGGIVGNAILTAPRGIIEDATVSAELDASGAGFHYFGGVGGYVTASEIVGADVTLTVPLGTESASGVDAGGVVGAAESTVIVDSQADVSIEVAASAGEVRVGGVAGALTDGSGIFRSFSTGTASATNSSTNTLTYVGGLAGTAASSSLRDSYSLMGLTAAATMQTLVGGLAGELQSGSAVGRSYAAGTQSATSTTTNSYAGGLAGGIWTDGSAVVLSFWDGDVTSSTAANASGASIGDPGVVSSTTAEMQTRALFFDASWNITEGWDPEGTIWGICEGETYPFLNRLTAADPCTPDPPDPGPAPQPPTTPRPEPEPDPVLPGTAFAQEGFSGEGSGSATITFDGDGGMADIQVDWEGLAAEIPDLSGTDYEALSGAPFPHAQHIHAGGEGMCPAPDADADGDGIVNTPEGAPAYGGVVTSLTTGEADTSPGGVLDIENFPTGDSASYSRTIDLSGEVADFVRDGNAVIVVHGLDPAIMPGDTALSDSAISEDLPLAVTAPALCGVLTDAGDGTFTAQLNPTNPVAQSDETTDGGEQEGEVESDGDEQVSRMPAGGVAAGGGSTANTGLPLGLLTLAAGLLALAAMGVTVASRRSNI